jgi:hypothetical protein
LTYQLVPRAGSVRVQWIGETHWTADELVAARGADADAEGALGEAMAWLRDYLGSGARPADDVRAAAKKAGIADRTLDRAKARTKVRSMKLATGWAWVPRSPSTSPTFPEGNLGDLGDLEVGAV